MNTLKDNQITITNSDGKEQVMNILFTYNNEQRNKSYIFLFEEGKEDDVMAFIYDEKTYELSEIEDDEEYEEVEEVFEAYVNDPKIASIK